MLPPIIQSPSPEGPHIFFPPLPTQRKKYKGVPKAQNPLGDHFFFFFFFCTVAGIWQGVQINVFCVCVFPPCWGKLSAQRCCFLLFILFPLFEIPYPDLLPDRKLCFDCKKNTVMTLSMVGNVGLLVSWLAGGLIQYKSQCAREFTERKYLSLCGQV